MDPLVARAHRSTVPASRCASRDPWRESVGVSLTEAERTQELSTLQVHLQGKLIETHALSGDGDHDERGFDCDAPL